MQEKKKRGRDRVYTNHGETKCLGKLFKIHGERAIGYFNGKDEIVGYATLEEILELIYSQEPEELHLGF